MSAQEDLVWAAWSLVSAISENGAAYPNAPWHCDLVYLRRLLEEKGLFVAEPVEHESELLVA